MSLKRPSSRSARPERETLFHRAWAPLASLRTMIDMFDEATRTHDKGDWPAPPGALDLTLREREVLHMIANGMTNAEAARQLHVSVHAIKFHLAAIYRRLGVANRTEAAVTYLRWNSGRLGPIPVDD
jgi:DNA-binding NarL/FixJ family response regulator